MRTSLNEIKLIDEQILGLNNTPERLLFDAMLIINPNLRNQVSLQKQTHGFVKQYGRKQLKAEIENVHQQLFTNPLHQSFRQKIMRLFNNR